MILNIKNTETGFHKDGVAAGNFLYRDGYGVRLPLTFPELLAVFYGQTYTGDTSPDALKRYTEQVKHAHGAFRIGSYVATPA